MTVICFDGEVLAVDSLVIRDHVISYTDKMWQYFEKEGSQYFAAGCGQLDGVYSLCKWYSEGAVVENFPVSDGCAAQAELIVLDSHGDVLEYCGSPYGRHIETATAWGVGCDIALGAMSTGANAVQAVAAACMHSSSCGGNILYASAGADEIGVIEYTGNPQWVNLN